MKKALTIISIITNVIVLVGTILIASLFVGALIGKINGDGLAEGFNAGFFIVFDIFLMVASFINLVLNILNFVFTKKPLQIVLFVLAILFVVLSVGMFGGIFLII